LRVYVAMLHGECMPRTPDLIGTAEAARILNKSHRTVHRMVKAGRLVPAMKAPGGFAGAFLFDRAEVDALAKEAA
jgi:excisionase family DNA binding protein